MRSATLLAFFLAPASGFQLQGAVRPVRGPRTTAPEMVQGGRAAASGALAASLALALSTANPTLTHADVAPPAVVREYGSSLIAASDDVSEAQRKFLEQRAQLQTQYETEIESTYKSAEEVKDKKNVYVAIVGGLIVIAFVVPMVQFFYFTGGD